MVTPLAGFAKNKVQPSPKVTPILNAQLNPKQQMALHTEELRAWMERLYQQYPDELAKSTQVGAKEMVEWVFDGKNNWKFEALSALQGQEALALLFDENYQGDRILALVVGMESLLFRAYGAQNEYAIPANGSAQELSEAVCSIQRWQQQWNMPQASLPDVVAESFLNDAPFKQQLNQVLESITKRIQAHLPSYAICSDE